MENTNVKYWCFICQKELTNVNEENDEIKCPFCKGCFIEEIIDDSNPQNFVPINIPPASTSISSTSNRQQQPPQTQTQNKNENENEPLLFLPSTVGYEIYDRSESFTNTFNTIMNSANEIMTSLFGENHFMNMHFGNRNTNQNFLTFLSNHNNDRPFENFINLIMQFESGLNRHPPASNNAIEKLSRIKIDENNYESKYKGKDCNICLSQFELNECVAELDCKHEFHESCIIHWLKMNNTCPICRSELESNNPEYERRKNEHRQTLRNINHNRRGNNGGGNNGTANV